MEDCRVSLGQAWNCSLKNGVWKNHLLSWQKVVLSILMRQNWLFWRHFQDAEPHLFMMSLWAAPLANTEETKTLSLLQCFSVQQDVVIWPIFWWQSWGLKIGGTQKIISLLLILILLFNNYHHQHHQSKFFGFSIFFSLSVLINVKSSHRITLLVRIRKGKTL